MLTETFRMAAVLMYGLTRCLGALRQPKVAYVLRASFTLPVRRPVRLAIARQFHIFYTVGDGSLIARQVRIDIGLDHHPLVQLIGQAHYMAEIAVFEVMVGVAVLREVRRVDGKMTHTVFL